MTTLLTTQNAKTIKGEKLGYLTGILYLAPNTVAGKNCNVCPFSDAACRKACFNTAGRGRFKNVQKARIKKTRWLFRDRWGFVAQVMKDIYDLKRRAEREGLKLAIRLNGTSDIPWESPAWGSIISEFPDVQFYDYTGSVQRCLEVPKCYTNYHLTFSRRSGNTSDCVRVLKAGGQVSVIFDTLPPVTNIGIMDDADEGEAAPLVDGDEHDLRFLNPKKCIIGLKAKGEAKYDKSGFVIRNPRLPKVRISKITYHTRSKKKRRAA